MLLFHHSGAEHEKEYSEFSVLVNLTILKQCLLKNIKNVLKMLIHMDRCIELSIHIHTYVFLSKTKVYNPLNCDLQ